MFQIAAERTYATPLPKTHLPSTPSPSPRMKTSPARQRDVIKKQYQAFT
jgi:hypothetical protein